MINPILGYLWNLKSRLGKAQKIKMTLSLSSTKNILWPMLLIFITACVSNKPKIETFEKADKLYHQLSSEFSHKLVKAHREIKDRHYLYEYTKHSDKAGKTKISSEFYYLLFGYFFSTDSVTPLVDLVKERYEDRNLGKINYRRDSEQHLNNEYALFSIDGGNCLVYRDFENIGISDMNTPMGSISVGDSFIVFTLCDYSGNPISTDTIEKASSAITYSKPKEF